MGIIRDTVRISGNREAVILEALFDTGADYNVIRPRLSNGMTTDDLGYIDYFPEYVSILNLGEDQNNEGELYDYVIFGEMDISGKKIATPGFVLMEIGDDVLIGHGAMQCLGIKLDPRNHKITI